MITSIRFKGVTKNFAGVRALDGVSFLVERGTVHAICGENGAGKSTLGKILAGIEQPDSGSIELDGKRLSLESPRDALEVGIAMVHQELAFCDNLSVAENLSLGRLPRRGLFTDRAACRARAVELLGAVGATIDPDRGMRTLTTAEQQLVQIAAAVGEGAKVIVFDEPTSSLDQRDADRLYGLIAELKTRAVTMLYVSHRMPEIFRLADTVTVLRDGKHVCTEPVSSLDEGRLVHHMIGRSVEAYLPKHDHAAGTVAIEVRDLSSPGKFSGVSFQIRCGEVVGLAGLVGAGRSQIADAIFGLDREARGEIALGGLQQSIRSPRDAMRLGIGYVPEDRKRLGLVLSMNPGANLTLPTLRSLSRASWIDRRRERAVVEAQSERLRIRNGTSDAPVASLSGGNQQKVVMAKWLAADNDVLILDEPTRGVDVGAKAELHEWIDRLASEGKAILLVSSELPELLALSTRILVLRSGRVVGEQTRAEATQESLMRLMSGASPATAA
jgi:ABC-type sugar transport system ATPase subunit